MATIGIFTAKNGTFTGTIQTLTLNAKVQIVPNTNQNSEKAPDYRVTVGQSEIGAGWNKTSEAGNAYIQLRLDDPTFAGAVYANLIKKDDGNHELAWSRPKTGAR